MGKIWEFFELIGSGFFMIVFGFLFVFIMLLIIIGMFCLIGMVISGTMAIVGVTHYTVAEYIPYTNLPECVSLNLTDEFVWNSPRQVPDGLDVIRCQGEIFYVAGGQPLFYLGSFSPPSDFPIREIEWKFFGKVKFISFEDTEKLRLKDIDLEEVLKEHYYEKNPPIGKAGLYGWSMP